MTKNVSFVKHSLFVDHTPSHSSHGGHDGDLDLAERGDALRRSEDRISKESV